MAARRHPSFKMLTHMKAKGWKMHEVLKVRQLRALYWRDPKGQQCYYAPAGAAARQTMRDEAGETDVDSDDVG